MSFTQNKLLDFSKKISSLPDQPNMQPSELKAYFDRSPEELQQAHNDLCDALTAISAAAGLGFQRTAGVPADTVQSAVENVQSQLTDAVLGNIPSGSVTGEKLAQDVRDRFSAIEGAAASEASTRASAVSSLQSQINTHATQIAAKCEVMFGTYVGDGTATRLISLGFHPRAVLVVPQYPELVSSMYMYGGFALRDHPCGCTDSSPNILITENGFMVYRMVAPDNQHVILSSNSSNQIFYYIAFK